AKAMTKATPKYVKPESGMTSKLETAAVAAKTSQIDPKPANGGVIRANRKRNMGASHAASDIIPLPKYKIAKTPPVASHTNGVEVLQLFDLAEKSPAFAILLKSPPLILRHLNKAVFGKTGIFQQNQ